MMKGTGCWPLGFFAVTLSVLSFFEGGLGIVASPVERQLEKFATRVGQKEYVSVFKEPVVGGGSVNGQKFRTYVLLSKLFVLPSNGGGGEVNDVLPGGPLKFRRGYIPTVTPPLPSNHQANDKIFFPKEEDATTRKTASYLYNKKPLAASDFFSDRKLYVVTDGRLSKYSEAADTILNPLLEDADNLENSPSDAADELGWYTLLSVPPRLKKASEGCPPNHRKDPHHNLCRPIFRPSISNRAQAHQHHQQQEASSSETTPSIVQPIPTDTTFSFQ